MEKSTTGSIDAVRGVCDVNVFDAERVGRARNMVFVSLSAMTAKVVFAQRRTFHELFLLISNFNSDWDIVRFT
jgi:hypothetical protein